MLTLGWVYLWGAVAVAFCIVAFCDTEGERHPVGTTLAVLLWPLLVPVVVVAYAGELWRVVRP